MLSCQHLWFLLICIPLCLHISQAFPLAEADPETEKIGKLLVISEDIIPDNVEKIPKKVIRVNPLELPAVKEDPSTATNMDSSLYNIQSLLMPHKNKRKYLNSQEMRKPEPEVNIKNIEVAPSSFTPSDSLIIQNDSPIFRGIPITKVDKFLKPKHFNQHKHTNLNVLPHAEEKDDFFASKKLPIQISNGQYPIYYVIAHSNGRFGKYPVKSFSNARDFLKYLAKYKIENSSTKTDYYYDS